MYYSNPMSNTTNINDHQQSLPEPSADALTHSQKLVERIRDEIIAKGGSITFRRYMEMALYEPSLGYYVAGTHKIGEQGDFITAPEVSPLFSHCIAQQCKEVLSETQGDLLELGAGTGIMATDILLSLEDDDCLPQHYYILDLSPDLKQRQKETIEARAPHLLKHVTWLSQLPESFNGIILGNEVLDAMPIDVFTQQNNDVFKHHVIWDDGKLCEQLQKADDDFSKIVLALNIPTEATPYTSEINPNLSGWFDSISQCLEKGVILLADYGYPRKEYYFHERNKGTLICHYQHLVNEAPLHHVGLQDITASVDFTAVAEAADSADLTVAGFTSQATFLSNSGLESVFMKALNNTPDDQYALAQQVRTLSLPAEMGERFKFIALSKKYEKPLSGFSTLDQRIRL
ncbi:MAG: SAM-dependent methyltransferase [Cocleimonas sp.]